MPRPSKDLTRRITLRMTDADHRFIKRVQQYHAEAGIPLSENDTIRALIQQAAIAPSLTEPDARRAVELHWKVCDQCTPDGPPRCPIGLYLRDCYARVAHLRKERT